MKADEPDRKTGDDAYALHKAVWRRDVDKLKELLDCQSEDSQLDINERDCHGNAPLHLAIHFRYRDIVHLLLNYGADPTFKNGSMWSPLQEAVASGDRKLVMDIMLAVKDHVNDEFEKRTPHLTTALQKLPDFYMEIHWEFKSWVPLVSRLCPWDTYKVWKRGASIRVDTTLVGFENMKWVRGNISIVFKGEDGGQVMILDHDNKTIEHAMQSLAGLNKADLNKDVNEVMVHSLLRPMPRTEKITFTPKMGWLWGEKRETVGQWDAKLYEVDGFEYITRHRNSKKKKKGHPFPQEDPFANMDYDTYFATSSKDMDKGLKGEGLRYPSEFINEKKRCFKGTLWLSADFPRKVEDLMPVFEVLSPRNKHFQKLQDFVQLLPADGFPVKVEVPVFPTLSGLASFGKYEERELDESLFVVPAGYALKGAAAPAGK
jgi:hypothetical protein